MRELKFRAWSKKHNKYLKITGIQYDDDKFAGVFVIYGTIAGIPNTIFLEPEDVILEQSTDFKDKNDKEIYDGDIVKVDGDELERDYNQFLGDNALVECSTIKGGAFVIRNWYGERILRMDILLFRVEVVGNIHENPELLEGEE